jgi:hypothetical protein
VDAPQAPTAARACRGLLSQADPQNGPVSGAQQPMYVPRSLRSMSVPACVGGLGDHAGVVIA